MTTTFVRHFLTAGVDPNFGLELLEESQCGQNQNPCSSSGSVSVSSFNPLERAYRPRILRKFPPDDAASGLNEDILCRLILPKGLRFCTGKEFFESGGSPVAHPFVLTREDGEKCYGISISFYEEVKDINSCHAVHTLSLNTSPSPRD